MSSIPKLNEDVMKACQLYVDNLIKPIHSLGKLEEMAVRIAGITGIVKPSYLRKALVIFGGDTAVDGENKTKGRLSHDEMKLVAQGYGPVNVIAVDDEQLWAGWRYAAELMPSVTKELIADKAARVAACKKLRDLGELQCLSA